MCLVIFGGDNKNFIFKDVSNTDKFYTSDVKLQIINRIQQYITILKVA